MLSLGQIGHTVNEYEYRIDSLCYVHRLKKKKKKPRLNRQNCTKRLHNKDARKGKFEEDPRKESIDPTLPP